jgi:hypothetical protein
MMLSRARSRAHELRVLETIAEAQNGTHVRFSGHPTLAPAGEDSLFQIARRERGSVRDHVLGV